MSATPWAPEPGWHPAPGTSAGSVWWTERAGRPVVVKRLTAPVRGDAPALSDPGHAAYWRREADVALDGSLASTGGIRSAPVVSVTEDDTGLCVVSEGVETVPSGGLALARALGEFGGNDLSPQPWWVRHLLADRLASVEERGGWPTLARTTLADVADRIWTRRGHHLAVLGALPQVPGHGDPTTANLPGRIDDTVLGVDWAVFGSGPVGGDVGYLALSAREDLAVLVTAYAEGLGVDRTDVETGAAVTACYTALTRAEWALARANAGPGALAGKFRHPSVAPYLRTLQRLFPQLETLL